MGEDDRLDWDLGRRWLLLRPLCIRAWDEKEAPVPLFRLRLVLGSLLLLLLLLPSEVLLVKRRL